MFVTGYVATWVSRAKDRTENIRRIGEMAKLFMEAGVIVLTAFISPYSCRPRTRARHG